MSINHLFCDHRCPVLYEYGPFLPIAYFPTGIILYQFDSGFLYNVDVVCLQFLKMKSFTGIWFNSSDDNQSKTHDKKEKKMVVQKPHGTMEYTVSVMG